MIEDLVGTPRIPETNPATLSVSESNTEVVSVVTVPQPEAPTQEVPVHETSAPEIPVATTSTSVAKSQKPARPTSSINRGHTKWTVELRCQFLRDCDKMSLEDVRKKWGFSNLGSVCTTKYNCKNVLKRLGVNYLNGETVDRETPDGD